MEATLALNLALGVASAVLFGLVGYTIRRRPISADLRPARDAFLVWWWTLSFISLVGVVTVYAGSQGVNDLPLYLTLVFALLFLLCAGCWGLLYYLVFLYFDTRRLGAVLAVGYGLLFFALFYVILGRQPTGVQTTKWGGEIVYAHPAGPGVAAVGLLFLVPIILGAIGYLFLAIKAKEPALRRRILIVGISILVWFSSSLPSTANNAVAQSDTWRIVSRLVGLAAAGAIYYAFAHLDTRAEGSPGKS